MCVKIGLGRVGRGGVCWDWRDWVGLGWVGFVW